MNSALGKATVKSISSIMAQVATATIPVSGRQKTKEKTAQAEKATTEAAATALKNTPGDVRQVAEEHRLVPLLHIGVWSRAGANALEKILNVRPVTLAAVGLLDHPVVFIEHLPAIAVAAQVRERTR